MLEISPQGPSGLSGKICLCGIGAAGTKVMEEVLLLAPQSASVCAMNLDARLLNASSVPCKIHLGARLTRGLGSGGDASVGAQAACESESSILRALEGSALAVLAAGLGGGTGSGVAPEAARLAKEQGAYVVSVVIRPFRFEGERRSAQADEALARLALYSDMVLRFDNDAMESLIDPDKGVLEAFSVVNALIARAVLIVPSLLNSSGNLLRVGLDDLLSVAGTGKGICSFGVGEASADASVADILNQVRHSPLFLEKRLGEVDDVLVLVRGGGSLTLQRLEDLVDGVAEILGRGVRLHIGASVAQQPEDRLSLTVLGVVPVVEPSVSPSVAFQREAEPQTVLVPEEKSFLGEGKTIIQPAPPAPVDEPERHPEPDLSVPVPRRDERELEEELVPVRPVSDMPDAQETLLESAPVAQSSEMEAELESDTMPDIKELEEGLPPEEGRRRACGPRPFCPCAPPSFLMGKTWICLPHCGKGNRIRADDVPPRTSRVWFWALTAAALLYTALLSWWSPLTSDTYHHALTGMEHCFSFSLVWERCVASYMTWNPRIGEYLAFAVATAGEMVIHAAQPLCAGRSCADDVLSGFRAQGGSPFLAGRASVRIGASPAVHVHGPARSHDLLALRRHQLFLGRRRLAGLSVSVPRFAGRRGIREKGRFRKKQ